MKYFFTGTLSQLLELVSPFEQQGRFVDGEKTYEINIKDVSEHPQVDQVAEAEKKATEPVVEEKVEPALTAKEQKAEAKAEDTPKPLFVKEQPVDIASAEQESQSDDTKK